MLVEQHREIHRAGFEFDTKYFHLKKYKTSQVVVRRFFLI